MSAKALSRATSGLALAIGLTIATAANATVTLEFNPAWGSTENTGASATAAFSFSDVGNDVLIDLVLTNTTNGTLGLGATQATLVGIAFDLPTYTSLSYNNGGTAFTKLWTNVSAPPMGVFDQGISTPRNTFNGGNGNSGLTALQTLGTVQFTVNTTLTAAQFESAFSSGHLVGGDLNAMARFQQVNAGGGSDKVFGGNPPPPVLPPGVPEPATWAMMIIGFGAAGSMLRRRRAAIA